MKGSCLCGGVQFSVDGATSQIYQCHCSLCRKVSGSSSNAALLVKGGFRWLHGEENISRYARHSGFRSDFCRVCGSPLPNALRDGSGYWVPAGLLDDSGELKVVAQVYLDSRAEWDQITGGGEHHIKMPPGEFWTYLADNSR